MIKRYFLLLIGFILLVAVAAPPVQAGGRGGHHHHRRHKEVRIDWQVAGAFYNGLAQLPNPDNGVFLFHTEAKGKPGRATIVGVNQGGSGSINPLNLDGCFVDADLKQIPVSPPGENSLVATFEDLSVLNMAADLDGDRLDEAFNCIRFNPFRFDFVVPIKFVGGFGRFEGATGEGIIRGQSMLVVPGSNFGSEIGTIKGTIIFP